MKEFPSHKKYLVTSKQYASESKIVEMGKALGKLVRKNDGKEYLITPFTRVDSELMQ